jgi:hypothetical protein
VAPKRVGHLDDTIRKVLVNGLATWFCASLLQTKDLLLSRTDDLMADAEDCTQRTDRLLLDASHLVASSPHDLFIPHSGPYA